MQNALVNTTKEIQEEKTNYTWNINGDVLNVSFSKPINGMIQMYDVNGQMIYSSFCKQSTFSINMNHHAKGIYILSIRDENKVNVLKVSF